MECKILTWKLEQRNQLGENGMRWSRNIIGYTCDIICVKEIRRKAFDMSYRLT